MATELEDPIEEVEEEYFTFEDFPKVKIFYEGDIIQAIKPRKIPKEGKNATTENSQVVNSYTGKDISLIVKPDPITNKLKSYGFKIPTAQHGQKIARFKAVVEAIVTMATSDGKWGDRWDGVDVWENNKLSSYRNIVKFLDVADAVGFYDLETKQRKEKDPDVKIDIKEKRQQIDLINFLKDPLVGEWRGEIWDAKSQTWQTGLPTKFKDKAIDKSQELRKALILLGMTPEQYLQGTTDPAEARKLADKPREKMKLLTKRLRQKTFKPVGKEADIFPDMSLYEWATKKEVPVLADIENPETGKIERINFSDQRHANYVEGTLGILKNLTRQLRHFGAEHDLPTPVGEDWSQKTIGAQHGELDMPISVLKEFDACLKNKEFLKDHPDGVIFETEEKLLYNETITQTKRQIKQPDGSLKNYKKGDYIPLWLKDGTYVPAKVKGQPATPYQKIKKFVTTEDDWNDAYFYYKVAMDLGWRAEEAFTSGANRADGKNSTGILEEGVAEQEVMGGKTVPIIVQIMTRKTAGIEGRSHHGGNISFEDTKVMIREKRDMVDEYADPKKHTPKEALEHGVVQFYEDRTVDYELYLKNIAKDPEYKPEFKLVPNKIHALIGTDGKYTQVGTMEFPRLAKVRPEVKKLYRKNKWTLEEVKKEDTNRHKIRAIMRVCYEKVLTRDMYDDYFKEHSLHALRHLFAQYWLRATQGKDGTGTKDFAFVMELGHWGGVDVLMNYYGKSSNAAKGRKQVQVNTTYDGLEQDVEKIKEWENLDKVKHLNEALDNVDESTNVDDTVVETSVTETTEGTADEL